MGEISKEDSIFWEKVNQRCGEDIIDIVMDIVYGRVSAGDTMERINKRCKITRKIASTEMTNKGAK